MPILLHFWKVTLAVTIWIFAGRLAEGHSIADLKAGQDYHPSIVHFLEKFFDDDDPKRALYTEMLIKIVDEDNNGFLDPFELQTWRKKLTEDERLVSMRVLFNMADTNKDRRVNHMEFFKIHFRKYHMMPYPITSVKKKIIKNLNKIFKVSDFNRDNLLDEKEFFAAIFPSEVPRVQDVFVSLIQSSSEKFLDIDEVLTAAMQVSNDVHAWDKYKKWFMAADKNRDGRLGTEEEFNTFGKLISSGDTSAAVHKAFEEQELIVDTINRIMKDRSSMTVEFDFSSGGTATFQTHVKPENCVGRDEEFSMLNGVSP